MTDPFLTNEQTVAIRPYRLSAALWETLAAGIEQRVVALSRFLQHRFVDGVLPTLADASSASRRVLTEFDLLPDAGFSTAQWGWFISTDLFIDGDGTATVLDQNFSCPVGTLRLTELLNQSGEDASFVTRWLGSLMRDQDGDTGGNRNSTVVLDAASFSSTSRENEFLATAFGSRLVLSSDLSTSRTGVSLRDVPDNQLLSAVIRRIDDDMLDPNCFRPDSLVGLPGLVRQFREGHVQVVNPPGSSLANNRVIGSLIPEMIRHYLHDEPILNSVSIIPCEDPAGCDQVLRNLDEYAIRTIDPLHPARPFFGSTGELPERIEVVNRITAQPTQYVARPLLWKSSEFREDGFNLRVFSTITGGFRLLPAAIGRRPQPDGGATIAISNDATAFPALPE